MATQAELFLAVKRYLREHPGAGDDEVARACGVSPFDRQIIATGRQDLAADAASHQAPGGAR